MPSAVAISSRADSSPVRLRQIGRIAEVAAADWDRLFPQDYPFTHHDFLAALERHGCVGERKGWLPCHLLAEDPAGILVGAAPLYLKSHSWGEFVFDFTWAEAAQRLGRRYYPKLLCAIPFTPASGPRIGATNAAVRASMAGAMLRLMSASHLSSCHALFLEDADAASLDDVGALRRFDLQYQWFNAGHADFDSFLGGLRSDKRRKLRQERRRVAEAGIRFEWRRGDSLQAAEWHAVYTLYAGTYEERGQAPYLSEDFLLDYGGRAGSPVELILAYAGTRLVAVALTLRGGDTLYGRHWGAAEHYHALHFETCYYQGIERCIAGGLRRYDAGTQGEHKLARGFVPVLTRSAHVLADERLHGAIAAHLQRETAFVESRRAALWQHVPFKEGAPGNG